MCDINSRFRITVAILIVFSISSLSLFGAQSELYRNKSAAEKNQRMEWWRNTRFGMFIHWGLYAFPAGSWEGRESKGYAEWIRHNARIPREDYDKLVERFNPVEFNTDEWALGERCRT